MIPLLISVHEALCQTRHGDRKRKIMCHRYRYSFTSSVSISRFDHVSSSFAFMLMIFPTRQQCFGGQNICPKTHSRAFDDTASHSNAIISSCRHLMRPGAPALSINASQERTSPHAVFMPPPHQHFPSPSLSTWIMIFIFFPFK